MTQDRALTGKENTSALLNKKLAAKFVQPSKIIDPHAEIDHDVTPFSPIKSIEDMRAMNALLSESEFYEFYLQNKTVCDELLVRKMQTNNIFAINLPIRVLHRCMLDHLAPLITNTVLFQTYLLFFLNHYPSFKAANFIHLALQDCKGVIDVNQPLAPTFLQGKTLSQFLAERKEVDAVLILNNHRAAAPMIRPAVS